jgi:hypothetical protein
MVRRRFVSPIVHDRLLLLGCGRLAPKLLRHQPLALVFHDQPPVGQLLDQNPPARQTQ